jgi:hypothetical protein
LLKLLSNLSNILCTQLHLATEQLALLRNYNNFHAEMELVAGSKKKIFSIGFQTAQPKKHCAQGYSALDTKEMSK